MSLSLSSLITTTTNNKKKKSNDVLASSALTLLSVLLLLLLPVPVSSSSSYQDNAVEAAPVGVVAAAAAATAAAGKDTLSSPPPSQPLQLKVLNLNTWGLFWPWSQDRAQRLLAIQQIISASDYDIILLQELWYRDDYEGLRRHSGVPYITYFESFNNCAGTVLPVGCSGLAILSRHPIEAVEFRPFSYRGSFWNFDGEIFVGKGVGRARVRWKGLAVDVFTTHLVSYTRNSGVDNVYYRYLQGVETARYVRQSDADIKVFGGDLNSLPVPDRGQPYSILQVEGLLTDTLTEAHPDGSFHPWFATFANARNTYTAGLRPERIDYLMYWARPELRMRTRLFAMPKFMVRSSENRMVSVSDHEALHVEFTLEGWQQGNNATTGVASGVGGSSSSGYVYEDPAVTAAGGGGTAAGGGGIVAAGETLVVRRTLHG